MSAPDRRAKLDRAHGELSIRRQCAMLGLARSGVYRKPRPANDNDLEAMRPDLSAPVSDSDFYFVPAKDPETAVQRVLELVKTRIPKRFGLNPTRDIQVFCPERPICNPQLPRAQRRSAALDRQPLM